MIGHDQVATFLNATRAAPCQKEKKLRHFPCEILNFRPSECHCKPSQIWSLVKLHYQPFSPSSGRGAL